MNLKLCSRFARPLSKFRQLNGSAPIHLRPTSQFCPTQIKFVPLPTLKYIYIFTSLITKPKKDYVKR